MGGVVCCTAVDESETVVPPRIAIESALMGPQGQGENPWVAQTVEDRRPTKVYVPNQPYSNQQVERFLVIVHRANGTQPLGMDVDVSDGHSLVVERVHSEGAIPTWNRKNIACVVRTGDVIIDVNGAHGDAEQMTMRCTSDEVLELKVQRGLYPRHIPMILSPGAPCMSHLCDLSCLQTNAALGVD